jgi:hypothetical protein
MQVVTPERYVEILNERLAKTGENYPRYWLTDNKAGFDYPRDDETLHVYVEISQQVAREYRTPRRGQ